MAYTSYNKLWQIEFDNIVSAKGIMQDINLNHIKLEVYDTYKKGEKMTTNFEAPNIEDVIKKVYLDRNVSRIEGQISYIEKNYIEYKVPGDKQSVKGVLIQRAKSCEEDYSSTLL